MAVARQLMGSRGRSVHRSSMVNISPALAPSFIRVSMEQGWLQDNVLKSPDEQ